MYCPNCKQEYDGKFCPECGTKLIEKPAMSGANLNLGDANAISGGLNVNDSHNVHNEDKSVHNTSNNTSTVNNITQVFHVYGQAGAEVMGSIHPEKKKINPNTWLLLTGDEIDFDELEAYWNDWGEPNFSDNNIEEATPNVLNNAFIRIKKNEIRAITLLHPAEPLAMGYVKEGNSFFIIWSNEDTNKDEYRITTSKGIGYIKQAFSNFLESNTLPDYRAWNYLRFSSLLS